MRPHVEMIQESDYVWHVAEMPQGEGKAQQRNLSVDEEDGSSSLRVNFKSKWGRGPGVHHGDTEYYVLSGEMQLGDQKIGKGGYLHAPKGVPMDSLVFTEGSEILHWREYGDAGFDRTDNAKVGRWADARGEILVMDSDAMKWQEVPNAGPQPGLFVKYLHRDAVTGFYTRLVHSQEGWTDHRLAHHPCYEEAYTLAGNMSYNFGTCKAGSYFFRPARIKHGHFVALEGGATWIMRSDGELTNWYTQREWIRWGGEAVNYGPDGGRMTFSQSSYDLADRPTTRTAYDIKQMEDSVAYQHSQGLPDADYQQHGIGEDPSLTALGLGHDHGHGDDHSHDVTAEWPDPSTLGHPDERTDKGAYNWGTGRPYKANEGMHIPAPIISSLPVRSRTHGRWDGDGM
jgi:hypothetical protein